MLKELTLTNFKSFAGEPQTIPFAPVTIFVGANGSGKSNAFDAIRFLQGIGLRLRLSEALGGKFSGGKEVFGGIRGGTAEAAWSFGSPIAMAVEVELRIEERQPHVRTSRKLNFTKEDSSASTLLVHRIQFDLDESAMVNEESLYQKDRLHQSVLVKADRSQLAAWFGSPEDGVELGEVEFLASTLSSVAYGDNAELAGTVRAYQRQWERLNFIELDPAQMRDYSDARVAQLESGGRNLSSVLTRICDDPRQRDLVLEWVNALGSLQVTSIEFLPTQLGDVLVALVEENGERRTISARSLSDGTLRFLGYLAALFSAPQDSVLLFEEIENGLHPTRVHLLVELFEQVAESRGIQIIATTHNPMVLLALSEQALRSAVLFARVEDHPGTIVRRLGDLPHFDEVRKRTHIDRLFSTGWLERDL